MTERSARLAKQKSACHGPDCTATRAVGRRARPSSHLSLRAWASVLAPRPALGDGSFRASFAPGGRFLVVGRTCRDPCGWVLSGCVECGTLRRNGARAVPDLGVWRSRDRDTMTGNVHRFRVPTRNRVSDPPSVHDLDITSAGMRRHRDTCSPPPVELVETNSRLSDQHRCCHRCWRASGQCRQSRTVRAVDYCHAETVGDVSTTAPSPWVQEIVNAKVRADGRRTCSGQTSGPQAREPSPCWAESR